MNNPTDKQDDGYFVFREARNADELLTLLRLRYQVYRASKYIKYVSENQLGFDLDEHDLHSSHFGLFFHSASYGSKPVGYQRAVWADTNRINDNAVSLMNRYRIDNRQIIALRNTPLPLLTYFPSLNSIASLGIECSTDRNHLVEPSRFSLDPSIRSIRIAHRFVAMVFAGFVASGIKHAVLTCSPSQERFYAQFGFSRVPGTEISIIPDKDVSLVCLIGSAEGLPRGVSDFVLSMADIYRKHGKLYYNPANPDCFTEPTGVQAQPEHSAAAAA